VSERKLVSVVTGTWQRHDLLLGAIENVRQQTYRPLEHVIVADGPDPWLARSHAEDWPETDELDSQGLYLRSCGVDDVPIRFVELGFHSSSLLRDSISAAPFMVAQLLARGEYQITFSDDERFSTPTPSPSWWTTSKRTTLTSPTRKRRSPSPGTTAGT
jgi:glycosyltransferase involved in cell wall biosynthesis